MTALEPPRQIPPPAAGFSGAAEDGDAGDLARFAFLTLPNYSMIALANALEACRMANYVSGRPAYAWDVVTLDGSPVSASNGLGLHPTVPLGTVRPFDVLLVCGGIDVRHATSRPLAETLRRLARHGVRLGALCTGTFVLAEAGLLDGHRCAIHWENLAAIREEFPAVEFVDDLYVIDRDRLTCTGGVAPLDMMLTLIEARMGRELAARVRTEFIVERARRADDPQVARSLADLRQRQPVLERAARLMEDNIETPLPIAEIAEASGVSARQLERLFKTHVGLRPGQFYAALRLERARALLRLGTLPVTEISMACGYQSPAHFSTAYRRHFGHSPQAERRR
jgi:transcriptional regulator GlxA family with amidase domain